MGLFLWSIFYFVSLQVVNAWPEQRIVGGLLAKEGQFPWHVSIIGTDQAGKQQLCSGSLIAHRWVVTAAHCVKNMTSFNIGLGSNDLTKPTLGFKKLTEYFVHPEYVQQTKHNDIGLIRLPRLVQEDDSIKIMNLPINRSNVTYNQFLGYVSGFGRYVNNSHVVSRDLRWTRVQVISNEECTQSFGSEIVVPTTVCAISVFNMGQNTCGGDSGGALVIFDEGKYIQIGVVSFAAKDMCGDGHPSGFMRIRSYLQWMHDVMAKNA